jgi:glutathionyl-hydroquinone reductase
MVLPTLAVWDKKTGNIVNNESSDIIRMFNEAFNEITGERTDYCPAAFHSEIDAINKRIYETLNNGVSLRASSSLMPRPERHGVLS